VRPRTLLVLFLVAAALGAFVWFYERKLPGSDERAKQSKKLFDWTKADVAAVAIDRSGQEVALERVGSPKPKKSAATPPEGAEAPPAEWRMIEPMRAVADGLAVSGLVESLAGLEKERTLEHPDRKALGLDRPQATVRLRTAKGETVLTFGAKVPTSGEVMVAVGGDPDAYAVPDTILQTLERDPGEWRDKQVFHGDREAVDRVSLAGPGGAVVLARRGDTFWVESPAAERDRADRELVDTLLADLTGLRADRFVDSKPGGPSLQSMGLTPPKSAIEVTAALRGEARPFRVELGGAVSAAPPASTEPGAPPPAPSIYAKAGDTVFETAQSGLAAAAGRSAADWRSKALSALQVYQVDSAKVSDAAGTIELARSGSDWRRGTTTISYTPVSDLLFAVTGAKATRLVSADEAARLGASLAKPALTIAMKGQGSAGEETVTLYPATAAGVPARASGRDAVLLLPSDQLASIQKQVAAVRSTPPVKPEKPAKP
jgi:Domain of unknown function (DUF4340)